MPPQITTPIRLDQFLKIVTSAGSGGMAKMLIQEGAVLVNGQPETRRRRQLQAGDRVELEGELFVVPGNEEQK